MSATQRTVAVTGATGFLGRHSVAALAAQGWHIRILARSQPLHPLWRAFEPEVVLGSLADIPALQRLVAGADAVLHLAGLIKARDDADFLRVNRDGARALADAMRIGAPNAHFLLVSSLAAREPQLSGYAASKGAAEKAVLDALGTARVSIIRPPAIYGPGDRATLIFFQLAARRIVPLIGRPAARLALIHVEDAANALAARLSLPPTGHVQTISDGRPAGYGWREILDTAAVAVGNARPRYLTIPAPLLRGLGHLAGTFAALTGKPGMVNAGKIRELLHEDWSVSAADLVKVPRYALDSGFSMTADWYRKAGWLPAQS